MRVAPIRPARWYSRLLADWSPLQQDPGFRTQWLGQVGSALGRETARLAIPLHVYLLTESAAALGLVALAQLVPTLLFSLGGGAMADSFDRRRMLIISQLAMAATSGGLIITAFMTDPPVIMILALAFILAALFAIEHPARISAVPRLVPRERLTAAIALTTLNFQASSVVGPAIAGVLIAVADLPAAYALQGIGYVWAAFASLRMPRLPPLSDMARPSLALVIDGLQFVRRRRVISSTFAIDLNAMIFGLPIALFPVLAIDVFGAGPAEVGLLAAARGGGAFLSALFSGWIPSVQAAGRGVLAAVFMFSFATLLLGFSSFSFAIALILIGICGATDVMSAVMRNAIVQTATPDELRGRVTALHVLVTGSGPRIGDLRAALMAEVMGAAAAVSIGGLIAMLGVGAVAKLFPELPGYRVPVRRKEGPETTPRETSDEAPAGAD